MRAVQNDKRLGRAVLNDRMRLLLWSKMLCESYVNKTMDCGCRGNGSMSPSEMGMTVPPLIAAASALCTSGSVYFLRASGGMSRSVRSFLRLGVPSSFACCSGVSGS